MKIVLEDINGKEIKLSIEEAKRVYDELRQMFGENPTCPIYPWYPEPEPVYPYTPWYSPGTYYEAPKTIGDNRIIYSDGVPYDG